MFILFILTIFTVFLTLFLLKGQRRFKAFPEVGIETSGLDFKEVISIIVPMRNEEKNAARCLEGLLAQDYPEFEVIVVDDMSTDGTTSILKGFESGHRNLRIVKGTERPEGWIGKSWALTQGVEVSGGGLLLFIDADTHSRPEMLKSAVVYMKNNGLDMLSLFPYQEVISFWERVIQPLVFGVIFNAYPHEKVNDPACDVYLACGQFILIPREVYEAVGGHEAVKGKIVEDFELAALVKRSGYRLGIAGGGNLISTRMYTCFSEIWEGWTKNVFPGINGDWLLFIMGLVMVSAWGILPPVILAKSSVMLYRGGGVVEWLQLTEALWLVALNVFISWRGARRLDIPWPYAFSFPLGTAVFVAILLTSAYRVVTGGGVVWKGRRYREI